MNLRLNVLDNVFKSFGIQWCDLMMFEDAFKCFWDALLQCHDTKPT